MHTQEIKIKAIVFPYCIISLSSKMHAKNTDFLFFLSSFSHKQLLTFEFLAEDIYSLFSSGMSFVVLKHIIHR